MREVVAFLLIGFLLLAVPFSSHAAEPVVVVSDEWMPYNGTPGSKMEGYAVEILRAIFERKGIEVQYIVRPWLRSLEDVRNGDADMVIGAYKVEAPNFIFPQTRLGDSLMCYYTSQPGWRFQGPESLEAVITGLIQGYGHSDWLMEDAKAYPGRFHVLHGEDAFPRMIQMLEQGRIQVVPVARAAMEYYLKTNNLRGRIVFAGCDKEPIHRDLYFGLSPAHPERSARLAGIIDQGLRTLRNTGQLNHLLRKYGLKDWAPKK